MPKTIGVDLDNTIINYDDLFLNRKIFQVFFGGVAGGWLEAVNWRVSGLGRRYLGWANVYRHPAGAC